MQLSGYHSRQGIKDELRRYVHNQLVSLRSGNSVPLSLRGFDLLSLWPTLQHIFVYRPTHIFELDLSYSKVDECIILKLCDLQRTSLRIVKAVKCQLEGFPACAAWPSNLDELDLSRNHLSEVPSGLTNLRHLRKLNLSGNRIRTLDASIEILRLPKLRFLYLTRNPITDVPTAVRLGSVDFMRSCYGVTPLPHVDDPPRGYDLSTEVAALSVDFERCKVQALTSEAWHKSTSDQRPIEDLDASHGAKVDCRDGSPFDPCLVPKGYSIVSYNSRCAVCLPTHVSLSSTIMIEIILDMSLHPTVNSNYVIMTPVVRITPHGLTFPDTAPAILILPNCMALSTKSHLVAMCSNTSASQTTCWKTLPGICETLPGVCETLPGVCETLPGVCSWCCGYIKFPTTHFSMFACVKTPSYPVIQSTISPKDGGSLLMPELPGFIVQFPPQAVQSEVLVQATVFFADEPYHFEDNDSNGLASVCIALEPHNLEFLRAVHVIMPILGYAAMRSIDACLQLWYSSSYAHSIAALDWTLVEDIELSINETENGPVAEFSLYHFSFYKLLWKYCQDTMNRITNGAYVTYRRLRSCTIGMFCEVFLSYPLSDYTCAMALVAYKFGNPLPEMSNYPLKVGSGSIVQLTTGPITVALHGAFLARIEHNDSLNKTVQFNGDDFSVQFSLILNTNLEPNKILGVMRFVSSGQPDSVSSDQINLIVPSYFRGDVPSNIPLPSYVECTPPWSSEGDHLSDNPDCCDLSRKRKLESQSPMLTKHSLRVIGGMLPTDDERFLLKIARDINDHWFEVGIALGLSHDILESISRAKNADGSHLKSFEVLIEWKQRACDDFTYQHLALALEECRLNRCAQKYCYYRS